MNQFLKLFLLIVFLNFFAGLTICMNCVHGRRPVISGTIVLILMTWLATRPTRQISIHVRILNFILGPDMANLLNRTLKLTTFG